MAGAARRRRCSQGRAGGKACRDRGRRGCPSSCRARRSASGSGRVTSSSEPSAMNHGAAGASRTSAATRASASTGIGRGGTPGVSLGNRVRPAVREREARVAPERMSDDSDAPELRLPGGSLRTTQPSRAPRSHPVDAGRGCRPCPPGGCRRGCSPDASAAGRGNLPSPDACARPRCVIGEPPEPCDTSTTGHGPGNAAPSMATSIVYGPTRSGASSATEG